MSSPKIPPLIVVALAGLLMWLAARLLPGTFSLPGNEWMAAVLALAGLAVCALGVAAFRRAATTANPLTPEAASSLVEAGVYRFTRNPMYLGFALWLLAWGVFLASIPALLLVPAFMLYMNVFQIRAEERALSARFGDAFNNYARRVRRWL